MSNWIRSARCYSATSIPQLDLVVTSLPRCARKRARGDRDDADDVERREILFVDHPVEAMHVRLVEPWQLHAGDHLGHDRTLQIAGRRQLEPTIFHDPP